MTRDELRAWLDRKPLAVDVGIGMLRTTWRSWFGWNGNGDYLGERSARAGPDDCGAKQRCGCEQCSVKAPTKSPSADATELQKESDGA